MDDYPVKPEGTGWRDQRLSARHRDWGFNVPAVDVDWFVIEYDLAKVMAVIDYKHDPAYWPPDETSANARALRDMADRGRMPFFIVAYGVDLDWYEPWCVGELASAWADYHGKRLSELEWVEFLYRLRARRLPPTIAARLAS
jgi:hypothetical protein